MYKYRAKLRREVVEVNNQDALSPVERVMFGIKTALSETDNAKIKRNERMEQEFIKNSRLVKDYVIYIKSQCNKVFKEHKGGTMLILLDKEVESVLPQIMKNKNLKRYEFKLGYVDPVALKTKKNLRIPLYIRDVAE